MISVITPTVRKDRLAIVRKALKQQEFRAFEWLIGSSFDPEIPEAIWVKDDFKGGVWTLNRCYNSLIKKAKGNLIVSWQDSIWANPNALWKFQFHFNTEPKTLVTGVGDQYSDKTWLNKVWSDPRKREDQGSLYKCNWQDIEWNFCSCPKQALVDIGGFDENLDFLGYGMDGYGVNNRIAALKAGYDFKIDQTNESFSIKHGRVGGAKEWEKENLIHGGYEKRRQEMIDNDSWPVLSFL